MRAGVEMCSGVQIRAGVQMCSCVQGITARARDGILKLGKQVDFRGENVVYYCQEMSQLYKIWEEK